MNVLVLGGTQFVGRHIVDQLLDAGHTVSILTRGRTNPDLYPEAEHLVDDRDGDLHALKAAIAERSAVGRSFDAWRNRRRR